MEIIMSDPLSWLLEHDDLNPGPRYFALRELLHRPEEDPEVRAAQEAVMSSGPVPVILQNQDPGGFWVKPGANYGPKYTGTLWSIIFLAQLGADGRHEQVRTGGEYVFSHYPAPEGGLSGDGRRSFLIHCLQGNLVAALIDLGWLGDERLERGIDWLARSITGEGIALHTEKGAPVRFLRSGNSGPDFLCSANDHMPCAWGAVKALLGLSKIPVEKRTPAVQRAIDAGVEFLLSRDPAAADYPMGTAEKPSLSWFRFGYPLGYVTDVLQNLEVLTALGYGADPRLQNGIDLLLRMQGNDGRFLMKYSYNGKTWVDIEEKNKPSKWVTLRALRVLHGCQA
jgi:hypothetical protein